MKKIFILTTASQLDKAMAESALIFAKDLKADITLLGTFETGPSGRLDSGRDDANYVKAITLKLQQEGQRLTSIAKEQFTDNFSPNIEVLVRNETLGDAVWRLTFEQEYVMVVMGGKKTEANDSYLCSELLSVTAKSNVPVLVISKDQLLILPVENRD
ncbi:MAG: hypothetical protein EOO95_06965 [Pedobacter sp.]|nr:MAG: hypothetical protein EOO95_06965 [Pedobacter sp.]